MRFERLGWVVAAALAGAMVATGFQTSTTKIGTVDIKKVFDKSDYAKSQTDVLRDLQASRKSVLDFVDQYRVMKVDDAQKFRDLSTKPSPSAADKDALDKLKTAVQADDAAFRALQTKPTPSDAEKKQLADYNQRTRDLGSLEAKWAQEFDQELAAKQAELRDLTLGKVKDSIGQVARSQGYSIVLVSDVAPYSANDITDDCLKSVNKK